jgi:hypothetical protein
LSIVEGIVGDSSCGKDLQEAVRAVHLLPSVGTAVSSFTENVYVLMIVHAFNEITTERLNGVAVCGNCSYRRESLVSNPAPVCYI